MMPRQSDLLDWCALPAVSTACGAATTFLRGQLAGWQFEDVEDGGLLALPPRSSPQAIRLLFVTHIDEIGGLVGPEVSPGVHRARYWGAPPAAFAGDLQAFRFDSTAAHGTPCVGIPMGGELETERALHLHGEGLQPSRMFFTFDQSSRIEGGDLLAKAIDPRATAWAALEAARELSRPEVGLLFCYAEECSPLAAAKVATVAHHRFPNLEYVVNADVPAPGNIEGCAVGEVALRHMEGTRQIDPCFSLRVYESLEARGADIRLAVARTGSQTAAFVPYARCLSIALPAEEIHTRRARIPLSAIDHCGTVLREIAGLLLSDSLA
jgi:putative aminopeptidase FrvX